MVFIVIFHQKSSYFGNFLKKFPNLDVFFSNFGDNFELKELLRKKALEIIKKTSPNQWKHFLRREAQLRRRWFDLLNVYLSEEECANFINSIFFLLKGKKFQKI